MYKISLKTLLNNRTTVNLLFLLIAIGIVGWLTTAQYSLRQIEIQINGTKEAANKNIIAVEAIRVDVFALKSDMYSIRADIREIKDDLSTLSKRAPEVKTNLTQANCATTASKLK